MADDFYLPAAPPKHLTGYVLHVLSEKRVVGASVRRHTGIRHNDTEARRVGKHASMGLLDAEHIESAKRNSIRYTDVTKFSQFCDPLSAARGASLVVQPSEKAQEMLAEFRQKRAAARIQAQGARERVESRTICRLAPGEDALHAARRTIEMARAARADVVRQKREDVQALFDSFYQP